MTSSTRSRSDTATTAQPSTSGQRVGDHIGRSRETNAQRRNSPETVASDGGNIAVGGGKHVADPGAVGRDDDDDYDEADSSLVLADDPIAMDTGPRWTGQASIRGSSEPLRMLLLTFVFVGITFTWGIEMTYCTPYLLSLGLTKSKTSLVWVAGPLSGLIVQPIVGAVSDASTSRFGRRRPLILSCAVLVSICLLLLGFTAEIVDFFFWFRPDHKDDPADVQEAQALRQRFVIVGAVLSIYAVDFAINAVMACARSLIVDTLPLAKQQHGAAWASRISSLGHILAYGMGAIDMVGIFGESVLGNTQFKQLTVVAAVVMLLSSLVTCSTVKERVLLYSAPPNALSDGKMKKKRFKAIRRIWTTLLHLPPRISIICWAQFWSWIGWFPFLFYSTTWVGETYFRYDLQSKTATGGDKQSMTMIMRRGDDNNNTDPSKQVPTDALGAIGRVGSTSLVIYSIVTLTAAWFLPLLVRSPEDDQADEEDGGEGHGAKSAGGSDTDWGQRFKRYTRQWRASKPDLLTAWIGGHLMFATAMFFAPLAASFRVATVLVALCGIPWALAMWAPVTFLGVEVNKLSHSEGSSSYRRLSNRDVELHDLESQEMASSAHPTTQAETPKQMQQKTSRRLSTASSSSSASSSSLLAVENKSAPFIMPTEPLPPLPHHAEPAAITGHHSNSTIAMNRRSTGAGAASASSNSASPKEQDGLAGLYFGILNIFTTLPQFIGTFISTIVFAIFEPGKSPELAAGESNDSTGGDLGAGSGSENPTGGGSGLNAIAICLFIGACCAVVAAWVTQRLRYL